jgi:hypothetical protein
MQKGLAEAKPLIFLVARGGIEPPTQGFSILCSYAQSFFGHLSDTMAENKKAALGGYS